MACKYVVEGLMGKKVVEGYLVKWEGDYKPTWEKAPKIEEDCPQLVAEFDNKETVVFRVLKLAMPPSSSRLSWDVVASLLDMTVAQSNWKPKERGTEKPNGHCTALTCYDSLKLHAEVVDENYDEASKLPLLWMILVDALVSYPKVRDKELILLPQARLMKGHEFKTDYAI